MRVELAFTGQHPGRPSTPLVAARPDPALRGWTALAETTDDACLVLDRSALIAACSRSAIAVLGLPDRASILGRGLLDGVLHPVDFTADGHRLSDWELAHLPPLASLTTGSLARSLIRIRRGHAAHTVDAVAAPLHHGADLIGSLTFFHEI